jgi:ketosteroid isomerase-like protein
MAPSAAGQMASKAGTHAQHLRAGNIDRNYSGFGDTRPNDERIAKTGHGQQVIQLAATDHVETRQQTARVTAVVTFRGGEIIR